MYYNEDIVSFLDTYYNNLTTSIAWENQLLEPASKEDWIKTVKACARAQQRICLENQQLLERFFYPLKKNPELLSDEGYDIMLAFCQKFYYSPLVEPTLLLEFTDILLPHYERKNDMESLIFLYICIGYTNMEISRTGDKEAGARSVAAYKKVLSFRDEIEHFESPLSRDYIFIAYSNLLIAETATRNLGLDEAYSYWQELCSIRSRKKFRQYDKTNPRIPQLTEWALSNFCSHSASLCMDAVEIPESIAPILEDMTLERYQAEMKQTGSLEQCSYPVVMNCYRIYAEKGSLSWEEAWDTLHQLYIKKKEHAQDDPAFDPLSFHCHYPINLIDFLKRTSHSEEFKNTYYQQYRAIITDYLTGPSLTSGTYSKDDAVQTVSFHPLVLGTFDNQVDKTNFIIDMVVSKHLTTFTHSVMVSYLVEAIAKRMLANKPELLYSPYSKQSIDVIVEHASETMDYLVRAALLHDIGKNAIIPIINTQHRKLTDYEFALIKAHPERGDAFLASDPYFATYQHIALGHHKSYDGTKGYPLAFDNTTSPYRPAIDLIHICDCLDAATDYLSRNYHRAKTFDTVMDELKAGRGTDYNPDIVDLILSDQELYQELKSLTEQNRESIYYDIYLTFVNKKSK